jgi:hypothetical protein
MTAQPVNPTPEPARQPAPGPLYRTATGERLHIGACPHILSLDVEPASPADLLAMTVCHWCRQELDGVGRTYFDTIEDAMRDFGAPAGTERLVRDALRFVTWDQIWVPYSRAYIALGYEGRGVAWVGKTYVVPHAGAFVELPGYAPGSGGGAGQDDAMGELCPVHFIAMSLTGVCDLCD